MKDKNELRKQLISARKALENKEFLDNEIFEAMKSSNILKNFNEIFVYVSTEIEVSTIDLIEESLELGKKVFVPLCNGKELTMNFFEINSLSELRKGYFGILEPIVAEKPCFPTSRSIMVVPGLAFSRSGHRVGYGKGFYDRYLSSNPCTTIGLCYSKFIRNDFITEKFDIPVNFILTEKGIINGDNYGR